MPQYRNFDAGRQALAAWESAHRNQFQPMQVAAPTLFSRSGQPGLAGRFDYVLVPAVVDAEAQARDGRGTLLGRLLSRVVARQPELDRHLEVVAAEYSQQLGKLLAEGHAAVLDTLAGQPVPAANF